LHVENYKSFYALFPLRSDADEHAPHDLWINREGMYSICCRKVMQHIVRLIGQFFHPLGRSLKDLTITDATANVGGSTLTFGVAMKKVNSVEINPQTATILQHNIHAYGLDHVITVFCSDYIDLIDSLEQDVIFLDPPWGGPNYLLEPKLDLYLSGRCMYHLLEKLKRKTRLVVLRIPTNFNLDSISRIRDEWDVHLVNSHKCQILLFSEKTHAHPTH
jgi:16S rRNA G966 N2-methylase RsmD